MLKFPELALAAVTGRRKVDLPGRPQCPFQDKDQLIIHRGLGQKVGRSRRVGVVWRIRVRQRRNPQSKTVKQKISP